MVGVTPDTGARAAPLVPRLALTGIEKAFGGTRALRGVTLSALPGEVHAIIGENGAGKSTLMKILAGVVPRDKGTISLDGSLFSPSGPLAARDAGIAMVHQELSLCPHLTVAENVMLGQLPSRWGFLDRRAMFARAERALASVTAEGAQPIRPDAIVAELSPALRQIVEIARALALPSCRVLVLDEPTSSLTAHDTEALFAAIRKLTGARLTVLYISHFLEEVLRIADRYTVLRDGESVGSGDVRDTDVVSLVEKMAGRKIGDVFPPRAEVSPGEGLLDISDLSTVRGPVERANLSLRRGEILGVFGLVGAGRTELVRAIFGLDPVRKGAVRVGTQSPSASVPGAPATPALRWSQHVGMVSEDRAQEGIAQILSVADNLTLPLTQALGRWGLFSPKKRDDVAARWVREVGIKSASLDTPVSALSGGNQQKVAMARLLAADVDVFLLDEPTRGIDVASKQHLYSLMASARARAKGLLVISSDLHELLGLCDRIAVMRRGQLGPARDAMSCSEADLLREAVGA